MRNKNLDREEAIAAYNAAHKAFIEEEDEEEMPQAITLVGGAIQLQPYIKVKYKNLSMPLKLAVIGSWIFLILNAGLFLLGFFLGLMGY